MHRSICTCICKRTHIDMPEYMHLWNYLFMGPQGVPIALIDRKVCIVNSAVPRDHRRLTKNAKGYVNALIHKNLNRFTCISMCMHKCIYIYIF